MTYQLTIELMGITKKEELQERGKRNTTYR
jgi:hypothetical protein